MRKLTTEEFIYRSKQKHGNKYDYSLSVYNGAYIKLSIVCKEHGVFNQYAMVHMEGHGCQKCGRYTEKAKAGRIMASQKQKGRPSIWRGVKKPEISGPNSNFWKGGVTKLSKRIRESAENKEWRRKVFERDNYICCMCGVRGGELNADHIIPLCVLIKKNQIDSIEKSRTCAELWDTSNGRTLCRSCHLTTETFGNKNKTLCKNYEQLI